MSGGAGFLDTVAGLRDVAARQCGVVARSQLTRLGVTSDAVDHQVRARRWRRTSRDVVVLHRGPLTRAARCWVAVLGAPAGAALGAWTALELRGLTGWDREPLHVVIARGQRADRHPWLVVHESRRPATGDVGVVAGLPVHDVARAAVDAAAWQPSWRTASGLVAAVVQQRLATPAVLLAKLDEVGAVRHRATVRLALADIAGGADSLAEIDFARLCRRAGLPEPARQSRRRDSTGRWRYLDVEWRARGRRLVVEVDGVGHLESRRWYDDLLRDAELGADTRTVRLRLPAMAARREPERVLAVVHRHLADLMLAA
ncbi:endonuclease domain-containing protein [Cellulosimicrobium marinum]|uniref:endonuclease domain-containing protein n=1 Tax=Cellulosimicrobium marinum TaxID=1638992 RepID=UPI001E4282E7|nr:endonuclease domain-containing protein [Cellulosimicrobium marinum]MCB7137157.1 endonuclease domain-containing protein [Cellulosimicrobium marinum]